MTRDDDDVVSDIAETLPSPEDELFDPTIRLRTQLPGEKDLETVESAATLVEEPSESESVEDAYPTLPPEETSIEMTSHLASGGLSRIFVANQAPFDRDVAVKFLRADRNTAEHRRLILEEGVLTGHLDHPNIVPVYRITETEGHGAAIVMKRIRGRSLQSVGSNGSEEVDSIDLEDPLPDLIRVLIDICHPIEFAHTRRVVHRDLKPQNVMLGDFDDVYVIDWGLAVYVGDDGDHELFPKAVDVATPVGTPAYMPPEMVGGRAAELSPATDQFMLGGILHFLMTGRAPYRGPSIEAVLAEAYHCEPQEYARERSSELVSIVRRAMAPRPEDRFDGVAEFRRALEAYLSHESSRALEGRARSRLEEIEEMVGGDDEQVANGKIFRQLGEARFGFRAALDAWEGNSQAQQGLQQLLELGIQWGLSQGAPETAQIFLSELPEERPTLRKQVEQVNQWFADRQSEGLFFEQAPGALAVVGSDGRIAYANRRLCRMFGYAGPELIGEPVETLVPERYRRRHVSLRGGFVDDASERPMGEDLDLVGLASDGSEFPVDIQLNPVKSQGEPMVIASIVRLEGESDVGPVVFTSRELLRELPVPVLVETRGEICYANVAAVGVLGHENQKDLLGLDVDSVVTREGGEDESGPVAGKIRTAEGAWLSATIKVEPLERSLEDGTRRSARLMTIEPTD